MPIMATEVMALSRALAICEAYKSASAQSGKTPPFYVTHITGILGDHLRQVVAAKGIKLSAEAAKYTGLAVAKREYAPLVARACPGTMIGCGARKPGDFTELVGGDLAVTIQEFLPQGLEPIA